MGEKTAKILKAFWVTPEKGVVYLTKDWRFANRLPPLFLEPEKQSLMTLEKAPPADYGKQSGYFSDLKGFITFLLWPPAYPNLELEDRTFRIVGDFNEWGQLSNMDAWQLASTFIEGQHCFALTIPARKLKKHPNAQFKFMSDRGEWLEVTSEMPNTIVDKNGSRNLQIEASRTGHHVFYFSPQKRHLLLGKEELLWADTKRKERCRIDFGQYLCNLYSDQRLGSFVENGQTIFRIFAPRALQVEVVLSDAVKGGLEECFQLKRVDESVWEYQVARNLHGWYYTYRIHGENLDASSHFDGSFPVLDPYALATVSRAGPGIVIDAEKVRTPFHFLSRLPGTI